MEKNNKTLNDSLIKIKQMMYYDSKRTGLENEKIIKEQAGLPGIIGNRNVNKMAKDYELPKEVLNKGMFPAMEMNRYFKYFEKHKGVFKKFPRGLSDEKVSELVASLHGQLKGVKSAQVGEIFEALKTPSDFIKLVDEFNTDYGDIKQHRLVTWMTRETTMKRSEINRVTSALKSLATQKMPSDEEKDDDWRFYEHPPEDEGTTPETKPEANPTVGRYTPCADGVYKFGCKDDMIGQVQHMLGGLKIDNMFGPKTKKRLQQVAPEYAESFTDADIPKIREKLIASHREMVKKTAPAAVDTSKIAAQKVNPKMDTIPKTGATNMAIGFKPEPQPEPTISNKDRRRINKIDRLNKKLGRA